MHDPLLACLIDTMQRTIESHADQLNALDEAIGDGDHGTNLARGLAAVAALRQELAALPLATALERVAALLERETGGAGGTYYGALFAGMAGVAPAGLPDAAELVAMLRAGVAAIQAKGGARKGDKTLLDVLMPVSQAVESLVAEGRFDRLGGRMVAAAAHGLHATTHMEAKHGLAADLGVASVNRLDPGACSCALLIGALVGALEDGRKAA
jgi:phosphoenolpyruvate---glycerone phosphotransferase subunit DhaL